MSQLLSQSSTLHFGPLWQLCDIIITAKHSTDPVRDNPPVLTSKLPAHNVLQQLWKLVKQVFNKKNQISPVFFRLEQTLVYHKFSWPGLWADSQIVCPELKPYLKIILNIISHGISVVSLHWLLYFVSPPPLFLVFCVCCSDKIINYDLSLDILVR